MRFRILILTLALLSLSFSSVKPGDRFIAQLTLSRGHSGYIKALATKNDVVVRVDFTFFAEPRDRCHVHTIKTVGKKEIFILHDIVLNEIDIFPLRDGSYLELLCHSDKLLIKIWTTKETEIPNVSGHKIPI